MPPARSAQRSRLRTYGGLTRSQRAERAADVVRRHESGQTFSSIGKVYSLSKQAVHHIYWSNVRDTLTDVGEHRVKMLRQLEEQETKLIDLLADQRYMVSDGRVVQLDGEPIEDAEFPARIYKELRALWAQKAKLLGLNAPDKVQQTVEVTTVTQQDLAIRELLQQQKALNKQSRADVHNG